MKTFYIKYLKKSMMTRSFVNQFLKFQIFFHFLFLHLLFGLSTLLKTADTRPSINFHTRQITIQPNQSLNRPTSELHPFSYLTIWPPFGFGVSIRATIIKLMKKKPPHFRREDKMRHFVVVDWNLIVFPFWYHTKVTFLLFFRLSLLDERSRFKRDIFFFWCFGSGHRFYEKFESNEIGLKKLDGMRKFFFIKGFLLDWSCFL